MNNSILQDRELIIDTKHFSYSEEGEALVLVPKSKMEQIFEDLDQLDDVLTEEDIKDIMQAREDFKKGEYFTADQIRERYDL